MRRRLFGAAAAALVALLSVGTAEAMPAARDAGPGIAAPVIEAGGGWRHDGHRGHGRKDAWRHGYREGRRDGYRKGWVHGKHGKHGKRWDRGRHADHWDRGRHADRWDRRHWRERPRHWGRGYGPPVHRGPRPY